MEEGKLYKVNDYALSSRAEFASQNQRGVDKYGYLWVATGRTAPDNDEVHIMRSLATGETMLFFAFELEGAE